MLIASYSEWLEAKHHFLEEENPVIECEECDGEGEIVKECGCCGHEKEQECVVCEGAGQYRYLDSPKPRPSSGHTAIAIYFEEVVADLKRWCAYTRQDFLEVGGHFVNEFRNGGHIS